MISLRNYLLLTYTLFICIFILIFSIIVNYFVSNLFASFVKNNIETQNEIIIQSVAEQFNHTTGEFNLDTLMALGMNYVHQGYIISITTKDGQHIWDARECDMEQCVAITKSIDERMKKDHQLKGNFQIRQYPITYHGEDIGFVNIETYNPYFYNESESEFMTKLNYYLFAIGAVFALLSILISIVIATALSKPILKAANTARQIASGNLSIKIADKQITKELHELTQSVNELAIALEKGERWQKRLSSDLAHELRTPLTTLQGNIEAMIDGICEPTKERLTSCHEEIVRMNKLIEDLSLLSILEGDNENFRLNKAHFDISKLIYLVVSEFSHLAHAKGVSINFNYSDELIIYADYNRLKQLFVNLTSNALKYTDSGDIEFTVADIGDSYEIKLSDTGIGIAEHDLKHIFERFYRSDIARNSASGTGIGLTIASAIVKSHGGKIDAQSVVGKGTVFITTLPKRPL